MADQQKDAKQGQQQDNVAEGDLETVEESIRQHEKKGDEQGRPAPKKK